jgi:hypothetical protein
LEGRIDHIYLLYQVLEDEFGWVRVVGIDAPDFGGSQLDLVWFFLCKEVLHGALVGQVQLGVGAGDNLFRLFAMGLKMAHDGRADHAAAASNVDFCGRAHLIGSAVSVFKSDDVVLT